MRDNPDTRFIHPPPSTTSSESQGNDVGARVLERREEGGVRKGRGKEGEGSGEETWGSHQVLEDTKGTIGEAGLGSLGPGSGASGTDGSRPCPSTWCPLPSILGVSDPAPLMVLPWEGRRASPGTSFRGVKVGWFL